MIQTALFILLALQTPGRQTPSPARPAPAPTRQPAPLLGPAPATVAGMVLQSNGDPLPNARVSLVRTDMPLGAFAEMVASERPPVEITVSADALVMLVRQVGQNEDNPEAKALSSVNFAEIHELTVSPNGVISVILKSAPPATTDNEGRFAFTQAPPGVYRVTVAADGYARQDYGQRSPASPGALLTLASGQTRDDLVVRMLRVGAASGHVVDSARRPIAGVPVQLYRFAYNETGKQSLKRVATVQTDDRGAYRLFHVTPGRYFLSAGNEAGTMSTNQPFERVIAAGGSTLSPNRIRQTYTQSYYPGTPDVRNATVIDIQQGTDLEGLDLILSLQQPRHIRGHVLDPAGGRPPAGIQINLAPRVAQITDLMAMGEPPSLFDQRTPYYNAADGTFDLRGVSPGTYTLTASIASPRPTIVNGIPAGPESLPREAVAKTTITVGDTDADGVILTFTDRSFLSGKLRLDQGVPPPEGELKFATVQLLAPDGFESIVERGPQARVSENSAFRIGVLPGDYLVAVTGLPAGYYVRQARIGDLDVLGSVFHYIGADPGALEIVIGMGSGQVSGVAKDADGKPVPDANVVLIPASRDRVELFRPATTDPAGKFSIGSVTPGDYILAAWEDIEAFGFFDPDLLKQAEEKGQRLSVGEGSERTVDLTPFPLPDRNERQEAR